MTEQPRGWQEAERAARNSYGRLLAYLAYRWRDLAAAEDALSDALVAALAHWPKTGIPESPDAWLLTVAKRELLQVHRRKHLESGPEVDPLWALDGEISGTETIPDERLKLLLICAHPAIAANIHTPLMLQVVLGLEARDIARVFMVSPTAMAQALVRAKAKIRLAGIAFEVPESSEWPERWNAVLEAIYGAYTCGSHIAVQSPDAPNAATLSELAEEAIYLARLVIQLQPESAEALGLLALLLYCEARKPAQFDDRNHFVILGEQNTDLWNSAWILEAEECLWKASRLRHPGKFQLEAAIQSAHCQRATTGITPWKAIATLYGHLAAHFPTLGIHINHAVALGESGSIETALSALLAMDRSAVYTHQPYWVSLAHLQYLNGHIPEGHEAMEKALALTLDERLRSHLIRVQEKWKSQS